MRNRVIVVQQLTKSWQSGGMQCGTMHDRAMVVRQLRKLQRYGSMQCSTMCNRVMVVQLVARKSWCCGWLAACSAMANKVAAVRWHAV